MPITVPVDFDANANGLEADLNRSVKNASNSAADEFKRGGDRAGQGFLAGFKKVAGPLAAIGAGALARDFFVGAIDGASDLQESTTKISAIFGKAQTDVQDFASAGAKALGQTKLEVLDAAAQFGTFGKAAGLVGPDLAKFSTGFAGLSTDLASFFNTDPAEAVEAIGSALRGEAEPIRKYGVLLDDATLRNEALRLGLIKTTKEALTPQQKVLAAQAAIYKQTGDAQGDFERTSDGLANQQRILKAQFTDIRSELGAKLLPVVTDVVSGISDLVTEFQDGTGTGGEIRDVLEDVGGALKDVAEFGKDVLDLFNSLPGPVKKTAIELGLAYGALKLIQGITAPIGVGITNTQTRFKALGTELSTTEGKLNKVGAASRSLGGGLRNVAGAGGLLALQDATTQTNKTLGILEGAAGGAALGFAVGGPWGAAIGGAAGGLLGIATSGKSAADGIEAAAEAARVQQPSIDALRQTVDDTTGAFTRLTKVEIGRQLLDPKSVDTAARLGINLDLLTRAASGNAKANKKVQDSLNDVIAAAEGLEGQRVKNKGDLFVTAQGVKVTFEQNNALQAAAKSAKLLQGRLGQLTENGKAAAQAAVAQSLATGELDKALQGIPDKKVLEIDDAGSVKEARRKIALLKADGIAVTRPQYKLLMQIAGLPQTKRDLDRLERDANRVARERTLIINAKAGQIVYLRNLLGADILSQLPGLPQIASGTPRRRNAPSDPTNATSADQRRFSSTTLATPEASRVVVNQNYYGPTTGRERLNELDWTLRYSTLARGAG